MLMSHVCSNTAAFGADEVALCVHGTSPSPPSPIISNVRVRVSGTPVLLILRTQEKEFVQRTTDKKRLFAISRERWTQVALCGFWVSDILTLAVSLGPCTYRVVVSFHVHY